MLLDIIQISIAAVLILLVLMQSRGAGLGSAFGGEGNVYRTKRGVEKYLFILTIIVAGVFLAGSMANFLY